MKIFILTLIAMLSITVFAAAKTTENVTVKAGQQKSAKRSKLKIKFESVVEDSRCPIGTNCIWAGNAKIKITVTSSQLGAKSFEINTTMGPQGDQYDGWAIKLDSLTPSPTVNGKIDPKKYIAKFTVTRLQR